MAFAHETDTAADVADWFANLEAFLTGIGWTVESGSGTTTVVFSSPGENSVRTKLFIRFRQDGPGPQRVWSRVQDDAGGTHATTESAVYNKWLEAPGAGDVPFVYWMSADLDMVTVAFKSGAGYTGAFVGIVEPFANSIPDEEYQMIAVGPHNYSAAYCGYVLREWDGDWNQAIKQVSPLDSYSQNPLDSSCPLFGCYFHTVTGMSSVIGQPMNVTGRIEDVPALNPEDDVTTGFSGATSAWKVFGTLTNRWAMRTGGILPVGALEGAHFSCVTGTANTRALFDAAFQAFLVSVGWTKYANPAPLKDNDYFMQSDGESGNQDIWIHMAWSVVDVAMWLTAIDDINKAHECGISRALAEADFPAPYYLIGDRDCVIFAVEKAGAWIWTYAGMYQPFNPDPDSLDTPYLTGAAGWFLRSQYSAAWTQAMVAGGDTPTGTTPNKLDGVSAILWPFIALFNVIGNPDMPQATYKYMRAADGAPLNIGDTITVGARQYVYLEGTFQARKWCFRIV